MAGYEKKGSVAELKLPESVWTIGGYDELDYAMAAIGKNEIVPVTDTKIPKTVWTSDAYDDMDYAMAEIDADENVSPALQISEKALPDLNETLPNEVRSDLNETLPDEVRSDLNETLLDEVTESESSGSEGDCVIVETSNASGNTQTRKRKSNDLRSHFRVVKKMPKLALCVETERKESNSDEEESGNSQEESENSEVDAGIASGDVCKKLTKEYDKSAKKFMTKGKIGHHSVLCPYGKLCEFNLRPVKRRSIFTLNRHILAAHKKLFKKQKVAMPDLFIDYGEVFSQRHLQCPECGFFVTYRYTPHVARCYASSDGDLRWSNDNTTMYENSKKFQTIIDMVDAGEHFDDVFGIGSWEDMKKSLNLSRVHVEIKLALSWWSGVNDVKGHRLIYYFISSKSLKLAYVGCTVQTFRQRYIRHVCQGKIDELLVADDVRVSVLGYYGVNDVSESKFHSIKTHVESLVYVKFNGKKDVKFMNDVTYINQNII